MHMYLGINIFIFFPQPPPAVIYEILYKDVFKLSKQVDEAVDILRCSNKKPRRDSNCSAEGLKERDDRECGIERVFITKM